MEFSQLFSQMDAATVIRWLCGVFLLPHTVAKLRNIDKSAEFFAKVGFRPARFFVVLTAVLEAVAAVSLIFNVVAWLGALIAATILFVAAIAQARINGLAWRWQFLGAEYMLFWAFVCLAVGFLP